MNNSIGGAASAALFVSDKDHSKLKECKKLTTDFCPHASKILLLMDGQLEDSKSTFIKKHIKICDYCKEKHELIKNSFSAISQNIPSGEIDEIILEDIVRELKALLKVVYQQIGKSRVKVKSLAKAISFLKGIFTMVH